LSIGIALLGAAAIVGQFVALLPPGPDDWAAYALSWALLGGVALLLLRFGRRPDGWALNLVPFGYLAAACLLLQSEATARTGLNLLLLLPVLWSSLYLRPLTTALTVVGAVVLQAHFQIAAGGVSGYVIARSLVLWTLLGVFIAVSTHMLRHRLERSNAVALESARTADGLRVAAESLIGLRHVSDVEAVATKLATALASPPGVLRRATFYEIVADTAVSVAEHDEFGASMNLTWRVPENPLVQMALHQKGAVALALDGLAFSPELNAVVESNGITHGAAIPVFADRHPFGVLTIASRGAEIPPELVDVLSALVHIVELSLTNALASERAEELARTEPMTSLLNRRGLEQVVESRRGGRSFTVLAFDLDGLKAMNDEHGHEAGDELICRFADIARDHIRRSDAFARVGGDEFLAVLFDSLQIDAEALAFRILHSAGDHSVEGVPIRASIGIATGAPSDPFADVARRADAGLYEAKREGGGKYFAAAGPAQA
jgi:diguanylate cyclase (GGDEF)-like protein